MIRLRHIAIRDSVHRNSFYYFYVGIIRLWPLSTVILPYPNPNFIVAVLFRWRRRDTLFFFSPFVLHSLVLCGPRSEKGIPVLWCTEKYKGDRKMFNPFIIIIEKALRSYRFGTTVSMRGYCAAFALLYNKRKFSFTPLSSDNLNFRISPEDYLVGILS